MMATKFDAPDDKDEVPDEASRSTLFSRPKANNAAAASKPPPAPTPPPAQPLSSAAALGGTARDMFAKAPRVLDMFKLSGQPSSLPRKLTGASASPVTPSAPAPGRAAAGKGKGAARTDDDPSADGGKVEATAVVDIYLSDDESADIDESVERALDAVTLDVGLTSSAAAAAATFDDPLDDVDDRLMEFQEDPLVKEALTKGVDLRDYGRMIEKDLVQVERESVEDYINQSPHIENLHQQIQMCDKILETMENMLTGFQEDLGSISAEIQSLQTQSLSLNVKIRNRKSVQAQLGNFLDEIIISPELIRHIVDGEVNEKYLQHLSVLSRKIAFVRERERKTIPALDAVAPRLDQLRLKATQKVRDFLLDKVQTLKKQRNPRPVQQQLNGFRAFNQFLLEQHPASAHEIHDNYVQIMSSFYKNHMSWYCTVLPKMRLIVADKHDLLGAADSVARGLFSTRVSTGDRGNVYKLGDRRLTLQNIDADILKPSVVEASNQKFPYEVIFRNTERTLMDNAKAEYVFLTEFFAVRGDSANVIFTAIFEPTLQVAVATTKQYLEDTYDAVGILLCIRINNAHQRIMQQHRIPSLEPHMNQTNILLWPRFQQIMDLHVRSLRTATPQSIGPLDVQPHYVTRRFAELLTSVLLLNEGFNDQPVFSSLSRVRSELEQLYLRFAADFTDRRNFLIFFINQYDTIITTLRDAVSQTAVDKEVEYWTGLLTKSISQFVEEELSPTFGSLIQFVKQSENLTDFSDIEVGTLEKIAVSFSMHWKQAISNSNARVSSSFSNQKSAANVLQVLLRQLLFYYSKFIDIIEKRFGRSNRLPFREELVGLENVKFEIKRILPNIS